MIEMIEIQYHCENCDCGRHSSEEILCLQGIVAYHHQMVIQLGENRHDSLSVPLVSSQRRSPALLVQSVRSFKYDV